MSGWLMARRTCSVPTKVENETIDLHVAEHFGAAIWKGSRIKNK